MNNSVPSINFIDVHVENQHGHCGYLKIRSRNFNIVKIIVSLMLL